MLNVLALACVAALYPTLLAGVIVMLTRPDPRPLLVAFLLGGMLISVSSGLLILYVVNGAFTTTQQKSASPKIDLIAGILSLILAGVLWARRDTDHLGDHKALTPEQTTTRTRRRRKARRSRKPLTKRMLGHDSAKAAFAVGLILNLPGIWYLVALKDIAKDHDAILTAVLLILLFNAIMFLLVEVPLIGYLINPTGTEARVQRFQTWLGTHGRLLATIAALAIGVYLIIKGIVHLN